MPSGDQRLLLAESVAVVIEVKSDLSAQWRQLRKTIKKVKALKRDVGSLMAINDTGFDSIPVFAVGYEGHHTIESLKKSLENTPADERPDAALVISSGCFVGYGIEAWGSPGLYALCALIDHELGRLLVARPNLFAYMDSTDEVSTIPSNH